MNRDRTQDKLSLKTKRIITICVLVAIVAAVALLTWAVAPILLSIVEDPESFRLWVEQRGQLAQIAMIAMIAAKVILPFIPGKPFEIGAGYAFGILEGSALCIIGAALGSYVVFGLVRVFGVKIFNLFFSREKLLSLKFLQDAERTAVWTFFIMLIPGTPKDFLSYAVGLTNMKFWVWAIISPLTRIPVVLMAVFTGDALGTQNYGLAVIIFVVSVLVSVVGLWTYNRLRKSKED